MTSADGEGERLTALGGLAALSLDALHNQRGVILERAIRRGTANVVLCRLRYRLATLRDTPR